MGPNETNVNGATSYLRDLSSNDGCQAICNANPACIGYAYGKVIGGCSVYGPGLDKDLGEDWEADTGPATTITGSTNTLYSRSWTCVAKAQPTTT